MPELPQELINAIVDKVPDSSLVACSLTSTAFVAPSQRRLFRQMVMALTDVPAYERAARLLDFSPHLGRHVRSLAVHLTGIPRNFSLLRNILGYLSEHVERVAIAGDSVTVNQISEHPGLMNLISLPSIKCLAFEHMNGVPAALISRALSTCEQVLLSYLTIADEDELASEVSARPGSLRNFSIAGDALLSFALHPMRIGSLHQLKWLSIIFPPITGALVPGFMDLLASCAWTLEYLELEFELDLPRLPALPLLKHLVIWLDLKMTLTEPDIVASILIESMEHKNLEVITFALLDRLEHDQRWADRNPAAWVEVDWVFANSPLRNLRQVEFSLRWFPEQGVNFAEFSSFMEDHLPRTVNAGMSLFSHREVARHPMDRFSVDDT
ncbi:hypothetical protein B0H16DRAFT_1698903 [Mycena metata]|uniref:F-box domain-containing protein n=1 Tax=Mycena metata TaxID=1033252 RepID=A0AAD7HLS4_9AGAR|nr:hypothetical protein B0H16DRAFT_1698903 [Mycena metata]